MNCKGKWEASHGQTFPNDNKAAQDVGQNSFWVCLGNRADERRARLGLGMADLGLGRSERAWDLFLAVLAEEPDDAEAIHWLLRAGTVLERWQALADHLATYLRLTPADVAVRFALASVYVRLASWEAARQEYETLRLLQPAFAGLDELAQAIDQGEQRSTPYRTLTLALSRRERE